MHQVTHEELIVTIIATVIAQDMGMISPEPHLQVAQKIFNAIKEHADDVANGKTPTGKLII